MALIVFPDNTVLVNFAMIHRMDLLNAIVGDRGRWCITVSEECDASSCVEGCEDMVLAHEIFGEPLIPDGREQRAMYSYRDRLHVPGQPWTKNLGEAETLAIIECRRIRALFVTDDGSVKAVAPPGDPHVTGTWGLLRLAHRQGLVDGDSLWSYARALHDAGRHTPPTGPFDRGQFNDWLRG